MTKSRTELPSNRRKIAMTTLGRLVRTERQAGRSAECPPNLERAKPNQAQATACSGWLLLSNGGFQSGYSWTRPHSGHWGRQSWFLQHWTDWRHGSSMDCGLTAWHGHRRGGGWGCIRGRRVTSDGSPSDEIREAAGVGGQPSSQAAKQAA